jgi:hypothetical protein
MARIARIKLTSDIGSFKQDMEKAKQLLRGLGSLNIDSKASEKLKEAITKDLNDAKDRAQEAIAKIKASFEQMATSSDKGFDPEKVNRYLRRLSDLQQRLNDIKRIQSSFSDTGIADTKKDSTVIGSLAKLTKSPIGMIAGAAGAIGLGLGVGNLFQRQRGISAQRLEASALVGGQVTNQESELGFTPEERRQRITEIARSVGRNMSIDEQSRALELGELAQRSFGISTQEQARSMEVARRAGVQDQQKNFAQTIGFAVAAGLEGSRVGEYLSAISEGIAQMSQGINIDSESLNGFAAALTSMPFFQNDPARTLRTMQSLNQTFSQGDRFQQAMASRAIQAVAPGASASSVELRRRMGLFGQLSPEALEEYRRMGPSGANLAKTLGAGPQDIIKSMFADTIQSTAGLGVDRQLFEFAERLGIDVGAADEMFRKLKRGESLSGEDLKKFKEAQMSPEELMKSRLDSTFTGFDKSVSKLGTTIESAMDKMAADITKGITSFTEYLDVSSTGLARFGEALMAATAILTAVTALGGVGGLGSLISKGGAAALGGAKGLIGGAAAIGGGGLMGLGLTAGGVGLAAGGGYLIGKGINWADDKIGGGSGQGPIARGFDWMFDKTSRAFGGTGIKTDEEIFAEVDKKYGNKFTRRSESSPAAPVVSIPMNDLENTNATKENTNALKALNELLSRSAATGRLPSIMQQNFQKVGM